MSESHSTVEYRDVQGFPGYRIGNDGSLWCCRLMGRWGGGFGKWRKIHGSPMKDGYLQVKLGPQRKSRLIHNLVLEAFVGQRPPGKVACHFPDRSPRNNALLNLRWDTREANMADMVIHGTRPFGEKINTAKLNVKKVLEIRKLLTSGRTLQSIADYYGVSDTTVFHIKHRNIWRHVP